MSIYAVRIDPASIDAGSIDVAPAPDRTHGPARLRQMLLIRRFEERCVELYSAERIRGFLHLSIGQEAVAVGVMQALRPDDAVVSTYRDHGHALARGIPATSIMAELFGKVEGTSRGRGGSMHLFDAATRFYGGFAVVGAGLPVATGLALADLLRHEPRVTACFFGDGAVAQGEFHEAVNLAALWRLPVLFCCENNLYGMGTALAAASAESDLVVKAASYGLPAVAVDGMDVGAVEDAATEAADAIRAGGGPRFLELRTYRFRGHSMYDPERYRDRAETARWKQRDPLDLLRSRLQSDGSLTPGDEAGIDAAVTAEIDAAVAFAEAGTVEPVEDLLRFVHSERR